MKLPRLHAVTDDRVIASGNVAERAARLAEAGGAELAVHVRSRALEGRSFLALAREIGAAIEPHGAWLMINGRADVARAVGARAVVSGTGGLGVADVRAVAPGALVARSVHDAREADTAAREGADFLVAGAVYDTASHPSRAGLGLTLITAAARHGVPVIAIGGVTAERTGEVLGAGAHGIAAIRALWDSADPGESVRAFLRLFDPPIPRSPAVDVTINGESRRVPAGSLADLLASLNLDPRAVVVEHNRRIVRREGLAQAAVADGDAIELVHFVGGG